jgi:hypothetical protein
MARVPEPGKLYPLFTVLGAFWSVAGHSGPAWERIRMVGIAIAMFIALFGWGANYFGWSDPEGKVQLALFTSFILGVISGYKTRS